MLGIGLYTQADVDNFQSNHGPCDRALTIYIEGADISNLDGLSALTSVGGSESADQRFLHIENNDALTNLDGLSDLIDQWDDAEPGPSTGGVPDVGGEVLLGDNLAGCNSIEEILAGVDISKINPGLNDAWYYPETDGQGFFITVFPDLGVVSLAWFTYDTEPPADDVKANLGDAGHRWLTALGPIEGNQVPMTILYFVRRSTQIERQL